MEKHDLILVTGAGGFIGGHIIADLRKKGFTHLRAVDRKSFSDWYQYFPDVQNLQYDLKDKEACHDASKDAAYIYHFAADMGGMGFIETHKTDCMLSVLINTHMLLAAEKYRPKRFLFSSSACVYNADKQKTLQVTALKETDAYPAMPEDGYGWEKLFSERMCRHFSEDFQITTRIIRYHNVYGPYGTFDGGREKAPAALCRKIIQAKQTGSHAIEIWGDGEQKRSFMYIDDCIYGTHAILMSDIEDPINLGSAELVSINQMVDIIEEIAGIKVRRRYKKDAPLGVRGRNSDNTLIQEKLRWEPSTSLRVGLEKTYRWIYDSMKNPTLTDHTVSVMPACS